MPERFKVVCIPFKVLYKCSALLLLYLLHLWYNFLEDRSLVYFTLLTFRQTDGKANAG